jgi:hypothetical protein
MAVCDAEGGWRGWQLREAGRTITSRSPSLWRPSRAVGRMLSVRVSQTQYPQYWLLLPVGELGPAE